MIETFSPKTQAAWHKLRASDVTASVAGALLGVHEFTSPYELWALKAGRLDADPEETDAMRRGRLLEPVAVQLLRELRPAWAVEPNTGSTVTYYRDTENRIGATPDVIATDPDRGVGVVQIKSVERSTFRRKWEREDGTIEPPLWIAIQAIVEATLVGASWACVAALVVGHGIDLHIVNVPLIDGVYSKIAEKSRELWAMIEAGEEPLPDFSRDAGVIGQLFSSDEGEEIDLSPDEQIEGLISRREKTQTILNEALADKDEIDAEIKFRMRGASLAYLRGGRRITWKTQRRAMPDGRSVLSRVLRVPPPL